MDIQDPITNFSEQNTIDPTRVQNVLAAALYYDFGIPIIIGLLKGNYTGEYRDTTSTVQALCDTNCDEVIVSGVHRTLMTGCSNKMITKL